MPKTNIVCLDFDGVIHDYKNPVEGRRMGGPINGTQAALQELKDKGYRLIIWSVRADEGSIKYLTDWFEFYQIPFDEITNKKPNADYYIDDKAIRFTGWHECLALMQYLDGGTENQ